MSITAIALAVALGAPLAAPIPRPPQCAPDFQPRVVRLKVYNQSRLHQTDIDAVLDVANSIWKRYGVTLELSEDPDAVAVVVTKKSSAVPYRGSPEVLGTTLFTQGHATPYIRLSLGAIEAFAEDTSENGILFAMRPIDQRDAMLTRMLGVALAHEMAHYLLDTAEHSGTGLLQPGLDIHALASPEPARLTLTPGQQRLLVRAAVK